MSQETKDIYSVIKNNYLEYGREINTNRSVVSIDGLKKLHRRILVSAKNIGKKETTSTFAGEVVKLHPHSTASIESCISSLVRAGVLDGVGNHGIDLIEQMPAAASRYTKSGSNKSLEEYYFKLYNYCKMKEGELEGTEEPVFLITPIPTCLIIGGSGIGLGGVTAKYPQFTYESLLKAYFNDNPEELRGLKNDIITADYKSLWETGKGSITYSMNVYTEWSKDDNVQVVIMEGKPGGVIPDLSVFNQHLEDGRVFIRDESTTNIRVVIGRTSGTRAISDQEIFDICKRLGTKTISYRLMVSLEDKVSIMGIRDWITTTMVSYLQVFNMWKKDLIKYYNNLITEYSLIPAVGERVLKNMTNKEIATDLGITQVLVDKICRKPISMLRKKDFSDKIEEFKKKIEEISKLDGKTEAMSFIPAWEEAAVKYYKQ